MPGRHAWLVSRGVTNNHHRITDTLAVEPGTEARLDKRDTGRPVGPRQEDRGQVRSRRSAFVSTTCTTASGPRRRRACVLVLQGMDAAGKDGTIRRVLSGLNPQGCAVANFKVPTAGELAHDYLWRVHATRPPAGCSGC